MSDDLANEDWARKYTGLSVEDLAKQLNSHDEERQRILRWTEEAMAQSDFTLLVLKSHLTVEKRMNKLLRAQHIRENLLTGDSGGEYTGLRFQQKADLLLSLRKNESDLGRRLFLLLNRLRNNVAHEIWSSESECMEEAIGRAFTKGAAKRHQELLAPWRSKPHGGVIAAVALLDYALGDAIVGDWIESHRGLQ
jgi:hypothetical protein